MIDLILKDIADLHVRENFFRLQNFLNRQILFDGDFKLFDVSIPAQATLFKIKHGLSFIPSDVIPVAIEGNFNFYFVYQSFDREHIYVTTDGPVRIRFLAGKLRDPLGATRSSPYPLIAPSNVVQPSSPGFVFGAVNSKVSGFWLTSEGIPSNVVGVPVLFSDAVVLQAAVGTEVEANYTIGIYQHEGAGVNLTEIGDFDITIGGDKRVDLGFSISPAPNLQLAVRLKSGSTENLKVSLVVTGASI